ncbi:MAG: bifunctional helix-turn-helix transcriptional regulator/GNAT family N-acetyltransferase [Vulcanimicrobiaceae bacterium]
MLDTVKYMATGSELDARAESVRRFNRFYTQKIGVLEESFLQTGLSLAQGRVLYELARREEPPTATELAKDLGLDAGYLSRILKGFEQTKLIKRTVANDDARQSHLTLTAAGRKAFAPLDAKQYQEVAAILQRMPGEDQVRLLESMHTIHHLLTSKAEHDSGYVLRTHRPGDMGWVLYRHGVLYAQEYGWGAPMEALIAEIVAAFLRHFDPKRERCWIAEKDGVNVGSVFVVRESDEVARLRLLIVEPSARGAGIGKRLVAECERFAREAGYRKITLWTHTVLEAARKIYADAGYRLIRQEPHSDFGEELMSETWELDLTAKS